MIISLLIIMGNTTVISFLNFWADAILILLSTVCPQIHEMELISELWECIRIEARIIVIILPCGAKTNVDHSTWKVSQPFGQDQSVVAKRMSVSATKNEPVNNQCNSQVLAHYIFYISGSIWSWSNICFVYKGLVWYNHP